MFKKISNSLLSPKEVAKYYHESFWKTSLMFIILLVIMMAPTVAILSTSNFLTYEAKEELKTAFLKEEVPFKIENGNVKHINGNSDEVYINSKFGQYKIVFTEKIENYQASLETVSIILCNDGVYAKLGATSHKFVKFSDYEYFKNIDLSNPELFKELTFWNNVFNVLEEQIKDNKPTYVIVYSIFYTFYGVFNLGFVCLMVAVFAKMRVMQALKFWDLLKISVYSLTPFVICSVFSSLLGMGLLIYVGYIISAIYSLITIGEVLKNTYSVRREGE